MSELLNLDECKGQESLHKVTILRLALKDGFLPGITKRKELSQERKICEQRHQRFCEHASKKTGTGELKCKLQVIRMKIFQNKK